MKEKKLYYKVVRVRDEKKVSCVTFDVGKWGREYKEGKWTRGRKPSLLFVFSTLNSALYFANCNGGREIWSCEAKKPRKLKWLSSWFLANYFDTWWREERIRLCYTLRQAAPEGTRGCEAVKLVKRVWKGKDIER